MQMPSPVMVRLSEDAVHLEAYVAPEGEIIPARALVPLIQAQAAHLSVDCPLTAVDLEARLRSCRRGTWFTLLSATPADPPVDGHVELLVPVPVVSQRHHSGATGQPAVQGARHAVRAGTPLARLHPGTPGAPGCDLLGRAIPARPPRRARLPGGRNTEISADGTTLIATCDGEVVLRHLLIDVLPMQVYDGDLSESDSPHTSETGVFVVGSVRGARIIARDDVYVQGNVLDARIVSEAGSIAVGGRIGGTAQQQSVLEAGGDITCGRVAYADLHAGGDIYLRADARRTLLQAGGNVYVPSVEDNLVNVRMQVGGGLVPMQHVPSQFVTVSSDRQHFRVAVTLDASIARHGTTPLTFDPCTIVDLSTSGARCRLTAGEPTPGTIMQLKFTLPDSADQILVITRVSRAIAPGLIALAFLQMTEGDHHRLEVFCLQRLLERRQSKIATRADRTT